MYRFSLNLEVGLFRDGIDGFRDDIWWSEEGVRKLMFIDLYCFIFN